MSIQRLPRPETGTAFFAPFFVSRVPAGFPSPADDYMDKGLGLNKHLIQHSAATFYYRVTGESMIGLGIFDGDILVVDRAVVRPAHGDVVLDGELTCEVLADSSR